MRKAGQGREKEKLNWEAVSLETGPSFTRTLYTSIWRGNLGQEVPSLEGNAVVGDEGETWFVMSAGDNPEGRWGAGARSEYTASIQVLKGK